MIRSTARLISFILLLFFTGVNLVFANMFGETCDVLHPVLFEIDISVTDDDGKMTTSVAPIPGYRVLGLPVGRQINTDDITTDYGTSNADIAENLDTVLRIYDQSGQILLARNDDTPTGEGLNSYIENFGLPEDATVIVEVGTYQNLSEGEFILEVEEVSGDIQSFNETPFEYDGSIFDAEQTLLAGEEYVNTIFVGERVQYTMQVEAGQAYDFRLRGVPVVGESSFYLDNQSLDDGQGSERGNARGANAANENDSCIEFYGFVTDAGYSLNLNGFNVLVAGTDVEEQLFACNSEGLTWAAFLQDCVQATVKLSTLGRFLLFVLLAILVVSLPIFVVDTLENSNQITWYIFLFLVVSQATTTAMLFLHLGDVSGIEALSEFGFGIFGGVATGAALVFIEKVVDHSEDNTNMIDP